MDNGERVVNRIIGFVAGLLCVVIIVVYCRDTSPKNITLGMLATATNDYSGRRVVIRNAGCGKRDGMFLFFEGASDRHAVVFALSAEVEASRTTFRGYVIGIMDERVNGCPHDPPFLLVIDVKPMDP